jgi:hypothetical protein
MRVIGREDENCKDKNKTILHREINRTKNKSARYVRYLPEYVLHYFSDISGGDSLSEPAALHQLSRYSPHLEERRGGREERGEEG